MTPFTEAAHALPGVKSNEATRLYDNLLAAPLPVRRQFLAGLDRRELQHVLAVAAREGGTPYALWADDPVGFICDVLGESLWSKPREILDALARSKRVAVPSCYASGKTHAAARLTLWFAFTNPVGTAKVVTLAPQWRQVARLLWSELRSAHSKSGLPGTADAVQLKIPDRSGKDQVVAYGLAAPPWNETAVQGIHCVDAETELLTDEGWKPFPEVTGQERVLTLNGDVAEWGPITKVWKHRFKGDLNLHDGARVNFCVTDNHRFLVRSRGKEYGRHGKITAEEAQKIKNRRMAGTSVKTLAEEYGVSASLIYKIAKGDRDHALTNVTSGPRWKLVEYSDLPESFITRRTNTWKGESPDTMVLEIPKRPYRKAERYEFDFTDWCEFLGWFVSEGWTHLPNHGRIVVGISQNPGTKYERIAELLDRMGISYHRARLGLRFSSDSIGLWLREHCGVGSENKRIPHSVKEARPEHMEAFLTSFSAGDGHDHNKAGGRRYVTSSVQLRDDLHEMLCKLGRGRKYMPSNPAGSESAAPRADGSLREFTRKHDTWHIHDAGVPTDSDVLKKNVVKMPYDGFVYCVSTPHQTIMVRRKGCSMWSGNSPRLLLLVDEAGGIGHVIGNNLRGMLTGDNTRMLAIGNPPSDEPDSWFEALCNLPDVVTIPISAHDTPNLSGEEAPLCRSCDGGDPHTLATHLVDRDWVRDTIVEHGEDSNYVQAKVHARFPRGGPDLVIPAAWVDAARDMEEPEGPDFVRLDELGLREETDRWKVRQGSWIRLGVDVAAGGGDEFVICRAVGELVTVQMTAAGADNAHAMTVAGRVLTEIRRAQNLAEALGTSAPVRVKVDAIGVGWGVAGILRAWAAEGVHDAEIIPVVVSEKTDRDPDSETLKPYRKRDEMWLAMRALLQPTRDRTGTLRLRADARALAQLRTPKMEFSSATGHAVVESKQKMKARGVSSPDRAEALILAVYEPAPAARKKYAKLIA